MIGRLNHVAIAVPDLAAAIARYQTTLSTTVGDSRDLPEHGVRVAFVDLPNTRIELMEPLGAGSPLSAFLERNAHGGIHHICYEVSDIGAARAHLEAEGARVLGDVKIGAHGNPVLFLHPKDMLGCLIELEEVR